MPRLSTEAVSASIRLLAGTDMTARSSSALEAFLVSKRLHVRQLDVTIRNVNDVVQELFAIFPASPNGRIQPFVAKTVRGAEGIPKWGNVVESGRKTVWNVTTRNHGTLAESLFQGNNIHGGLREDAADILGENLLRRGNDPARPPRDALAIFLLRDEVFEASPDQSALDDRLASRFGLADTDLAAFCGPPAVHEPLMSDDDWAPSICRRT